MKNLILVPVLMVLVAIGAGAVRIRNPYADEWKAFKLEHKKNYNKTQNAQHMLNFMNTKYEVAKHNQRYQRGEVSYKLAVNKFSDLTLEEFTSTMTNFELAEHSLNSWKVEPQDFEYLESRRKEEYLLYPEPAVIDASHLSFKQYGGGVYYEENCSSPMKTLNHAVLVIGYGSDELGGDYWLVKNSFGSDWGEDGYVRIARSTHTHTHTHCRSIAFFSIRSLVNNN